MSRPGRELRRILDYALRDENRAFEELDVAEIELQEQDVQSPRWPSGIVQVQYLAEGFYGFTAIAGRKKLGKSMIAVRSSVEAAQSGDWSVHYAYGENTSDRVRAMLRRILGPLRSEELPPWMESWRAFRFYPGSNIETVLGNVSKRIPDEAERVLVVIDSINRLARYTRTEYLRALGRICAVCQTATEESGGAIGAMVLSELNQRGGMVGMDIEYSASCLLTLRATRKPDAVKLKLESRESPGGELGEHIRRWEECRFVRELELVHEQAEESGWSEQGELPL